MPEAYKRRGKELHYFGCACHCRLYGINGRITCYVYSYGVIQACCGNTCKSLTGKRGKASLYDFFYIVRFERKIAQSYFDVVAARYADYKENEADKLTDSGGE